MTGAMALRHPAGLLDYKCLQRNAGDLVQAQGHSQPRFDETPNDVGQLALADANSRCQFGLRNPCLRQVLRQRVERALCHLECEYRYIECSRQVVYRHPSRWTC